MKALARCYVWWPYVDSHIERTVSSCSTCQSMSSAPPPLKFIPGFSQHDYGPAFMWTLMVQFLAVCTWLLLTPSVNSERLLRWHTTAHTTIAALRDIFRRQGLPEILLSCCRNFEISNQTSSADQQRCVCCHFQVPIGLPKHPTLYYRASSLSSANGTETTYSPRFANPFSWKACKSSSVQFHGESHGKESPALVPCRGYGFGT